MLASSIDLEVELETFAFVDRGQARAFHGTDVDECVRLTVVTHEETEALHCVEEFDGSRRLLTGQLALGRAAASLRDSHDFADDLQVLSRNLAAAIDEVELEFLTFGQAFETRTFDCADVDKYVFAATLLLDEAEAFLAVKELYDAFAGADNLSGHAVETATAAGTTTAATAARAAAKAATAMPVTAAETVAATMTISTAVAVASTIIAVVRRGRESFTAAKWIKTVFAETVALVSSAATSPVVSHNSSRTLKSLPDLQTPDWWTTSQNQQQRESMRAGFSFLSEYIAHKGQLCE